MGVDRFAGRLRVHRHGLSVMENERRAAGVEFRAEGRRLIGPALVYADTSPSHAERFEPGAFVMEESRTRWLDVDHDASRVIAWTGGGGLAISDTATALNVEAVLPEIPLAEHALKEVRQGRLTGFSVEFRSLAERMDNAIRVIESASLIGIGLVSSPSYEQSKVEARRRRNSVASVWIKSTWKSRKAAQCECQGPQCRTVSFEPGAFSEALDADGEMLALSGSNRPLASRNKGSLALRETASGDIEIEVDQISAATEIGRDLAGQAVATRVVMRPWVRVEDSEYRDEGTHRTFTKAALRGAIVKATTSDDGWQEIEIPGAKRSAAPQRRARRWL